MAVQTTVAAPAACRPVRTSTSWSKRRVRWGPVAAEHGSGYQAGTDRPDGHDRVDGPEPVAPGAALAGLAAAVDGVVAVDVDQIDRGGLSELAAGVQRQIDRLTSRRDRIAGELSRRSVVAAGPGREARAAQVARQRLADELQLTASEAKAATDAGRTAIERPELAAAADQGRLRPEQAALIGRMLRQVPLEHADDVRDQLVAAAPTEDVITLGRRARRLLADLDQQAAVDAENRRHARRRATVVQTADGMVDLHASVSGLDAETVHTAIDAFRIPDGPQDPPRSPQQRTADALVAALRASLDAGVAPSDRRVRPHLVVTVADHDLAEATGNVELPWTGPHPTRSVQRVAQDATVHLLGLDRVGLPISLSRATDHPTASQYLALAHRDGGCRYPGCDAPAAWCDVAHATARRHGGTITPDNSLLLCRRHHRKLDLGGWAIGIDGWDATFTHPAGRTIHARRPDRAPPGPCPPDPEASAPTGAAEAQEPPDPPDAPAPSTSGEALAFPPDVLDSG